MHGGVGMNSMKRRFLDKYGLSTEIREKFVPAIESFMEEKVDILLGNHVGNNDTVGKGSEITEDFNPFIDDTAWKKFLTDRIKAYYEVVNGESNNI